MRHFRCQAALLSIVLVLVFPVAAHGNQVISVTPTRIPLSITAGEKATTSLTLTNLGEEELRILPQVLTVKEDEAGKICLEKDECSDWVMIDKEELFLEPLKERQVEVTVAPPADATPGMRHLALTFIRSLEGEGEIGVTEGLAVLLELDVAPAQGAVSSSFPVWLPVLSVMVFALATGVLLALQWHRKRGADSEGLADDRAGDAG